MRQLEFHTMRPAKYIGVLALSALLMLSACGPDEAEIARRAEVHRQAAVLFNAGMGYMADAKYLDAGVFFDSAYTLAPDVVEYSVALGHALANQAQYDSARGFLSRGTAEHILEAYYAQGYLALREGRPESAVAALHAICPNVDGCGDPATAYLIGTANSRMANAEQAVTWLRRSIELDPHFISAYYALAQIYQRNGVDSLAAATMERFAYLRERGGTSIDLNGDLGTYKQGPFAETPVPYWRTDPAIDGESRIRLTTAGRIGAAEATRWVTLLDADVDCNGLTDLVLASETGVRLLLSGENGFSVAGAESGLPRELTSGGGVTDIALGDFDRNGRLDLVLAQWSETSIWRQDEAGRFSRTDENLPGARRIELLDVDHDSWLDIVLVSSGAHHGPGLVLGLEYWHNDADGNLTDRSSWAGLDEAALAPYLTDRESVVDVTFADRDRDNDTDLLVTFRSGAPIWLDNQHDGRFLFADGRPAIEPVPVPTDLADGQVSAVVGDVAPNGWFDVVLVGDNGVATVRTTGVREAHVAKTQPYADGTVVAVDRVTLADIDLDGDEDLLIVSDEGGLHIMANLGDGVSWKDISTQLSDVITDALVTDLSDDTVLDIVALPKTGKPYVLRSTDRSALRLRFRGDSSVPDGRAAIVDIANGSMWQRRRVMGPNGILVGLGAARSPDAVRVTWTSGIRQAVMSPGAKAVLEIDEKPGESSSCPFVYTWDGERFTFIADAIGGGVIGVLLEPPDTYHQPDPDEYLLIRGDQLVPRDGVLDIRLAELLREAVYIDEARLYAVASAPAVEVYPAEIMPMMSAAPGGELVVNRVCDARPVQRAVDGNGVDVTDVLREKDRRYVSPGPSLPYKGIGLLHTLTLDLGDIPTDGPLTLVWDGWVSFASTTSATEAARDGIAAAVPRLEVPDGAGGWRTIIEDLGIPAGKSKTIFTDLTGLLPPGVQSVRVVTSMLVYWDRVRVTTSPMDIAPMQVSELTMQSAELRHLGYPMPDLAEGRPYSYDYQRIDDESPWPTLRGRYTRFGGVRELLGTFDDQYVTMNHGEEIALTFDTPPDAPRGMQWDYFIYLSGYMKEIVPQDPLLTTVGPLPFGDMPSYPYGDDVSFHDDPVRAAYDAKWNTRVLGN
jgi:hypothetical protein